MISSTKERICRPTTPWFFQNQQLSITTLIAWSDIILGYQSIYYIHKLQNLRTVTSTTPIDPLYPQVHKSCTTKKLIFPKEKSAISYVSSVTLLGCHCNSYTHKFTFLQRLGLRNTSIILKPTTQYSNFNRVFSYTSYWAINSVSPYCTINSLVISANSKTSSTPWTTKPS